MKCSCKGIVLYTRDVFYQTVTSSLNDMLKLYPV